MIKLLKKVTYRVGDNNAEQKDTFAAKNGQRFSAYGRQGDCDFRHGGDYKLCKAIVCWRAPGQL